MTLCPPPQIIVLLLCFFIQLCWTLCNPTDCNLPGSSVHEDSPGKSELPCSPPGDIPKRRVEPRCPALQADSLQSEPPEKPKSPGVGSLSLLQGNLKPRNQTGVSCCRKNLSAFPFLPLKTLMVQQNLQGWFMDMSLPFPQVAGLLKKGKFPFPQTLISQVFTSEQRQVNLSLVT